MSKTDKTRPGWVQEADPLNQRFRRIVNREYDWFWKKMFASRGCWCCSPSKSRHWEKRTARTQWRQLRRKLEKGDWDEGQ